MHFMEVRSSAVVANIVTDVVKFVSSSMSFLVASVTSVDTVLMKETEDYGKLYFIVCYET